MRKGEREKQLRWANRRFFDCGSHGETVRGFAQDDSYQVVMCLAESDLIPVP
jgi:hypothetical protein